MKFFCGTGFALILAALTGCGGGNGDAPLSKAQAQVAAKIEVAHLFAVLRPGSDGVWYIQNDADHMPIGIVGVTQVGDRLRVDFDRNYTRAGVIQITSDDDFGELVTAHAGLGLSSAMVTISVRGVKINPSEILSYAPAGAGNFWLSIDMVNK